MSLAQYHGEGHSCPSPELDHQFGVERGKGGGGLGAAYCSLLHNCGSELQVIAQLRGGRNGEVGESRGRDGGGKPSTAPVIAASLIPAHCG